eukprot:g56541.t1
MSSGRNGNVKSYGPVWPVHKKVSKSAGTAPMEAFSRQPGHLELGHWPITFTLVVFLEHVLLTMLAKSGVRLVKENQNRVFCLVHAFLSSLGNAYIVYNYLGQMDNSAFFVNGPWPSSFRIPLTWSVGHYFVDIFADSDGSYILHHVLCIIGILTGIYCGAGVGFLVAGFGIGEVGNTWIHLSFIWCTLYGKNAKSSRWMRAFSDMLFKASRMASFVYLLFWAGYCVMVTGLNHTFAVVIFLTFGVAFINVWNLYRRGAAIGADGVFDVADTSPEHEAKLSADIGKATFVNHKSKAA